MNCTLSSTGARFAAAALFAGVCAPVLAQSAAPPSAVHQLWVAHALWGSVVALLGFLAGRSWALAGMVIVGALAYAVSRLAGAELPPEAAQLFGPRYRFHAQAAAVLVPLLAAAGAGARRTYFAQWSLRS